MTAQPDVRGSYRARESLDSARLRANQRAAGYLLAKPEDGLSPKDCPHLFKATAGNTSGRFDFMVSSFAPLTGPPLHLHPEQDDTFYVLEGILTVQVGDEVFDIGTGDFLSIPPGVPHTFDNLHNSGAPVRTINLMTPAGLFEMLDAIAEVEPGPQHEETVRAVASDHGTVILGPPLRITLGLG